MPIAAVVLTLEKPVAGALLARLSRDSRLVLGDLRGDRMPVAVDTQTAAEGEALLEELSAMPGVMTADVVAVDFSEDDPGCP